MVAALLLLFGLMGVTAAAALSGFETGFLGVLPMGRLAAVLAGVVEEDMMQSVCSVGQCGQLQLGRHALLCDTVWRCLYVCVH